MGQLTRLLSILTVLKSKRLITAAEIAHRFDVSIRTVYRDIRKLEEAGVPIITVEGKGYSIMDGYTVSPVQFSQQEVNALITAEKLIYKTKNKSLIEDFENALTKIKSTFRGAMQSRSELLNNKMYVFPTEAAMIKSSSLSVLQLAMTNMQMVRITYQRLQSEEISERMIEPTAMYSYDEKWIVIAWCHLRDEYRTFRLDRIRTYHLLDQKFEDRKFEFKKYFTPREEHK